MSLFSRLFGGGAPLKTYKANQGRGISPAITVPDRGLGRVGNIRAAQVASAQVKPRNYSPDMLAAIERKRARAAGALSVDHMANERPVAARSTPRPARRFTNNIRAQRRGPRARASFFGGR